MSREAMQLALEALESDPASHAGLVNRKQAITALRQALDVNMNEKRVDETAKCKHEWVGLTDEERREIFDACETTDRGYVLAMCEAKLREKYHG